MRLSWEKISVDSSVRGLLLAFAFSLPFLYDLSVPEVSGDIRWTATHLVAGFGALALLLNALRQPATRLPERTSWIYIFSVGLAIWAAISFIDSLNIYRGIMQIKALYAQLLLIPVAAAVWKPGFTRKITWALALPLAFASMLGIWQFLGYSDTAMAALLGNWWPHPGFIVDGLLGYYQQSAIPGSSFANKNLAGSWTAMILPLSVYLILTSKSMLGRGVASFLLAIGTLFLLYARARASWVGLLGSTLVFGAALALSPTWRQQARRLFTWAHLTWVIPAVLLVAAFGGAISPIKGAHSVGESVASNAGKLLNPTFDDVGGRIAYNLNSLAIIRDHWFNGVGLGAFYAIYPAYYNAIIVTPKNSYNVLARPQRTHTDLMQAFDEMGIPGGIFYVGVFLWGLFATARLGRRDAALKAGLWPLFAAWSLLTIELNALMDFPMQLPTAPAVCMLLMGGLLWHQRQARGYVGVKFPLVSRLKVTRPILLGAIVVLAAGQYLACLDSWYYRQANQILKQAMIRIFSGVNDDITLALIEAAHQTYAFDPRIHENMAVVYANYSGRQVFSLEHRIAKVEEELKEDPWGANHLVNLAGLYLQLAEINQHNGHLDVTQKALIRANQLYQRLLRVADFSHYTYGIGGMIELMSGHPANAIPIFERALVIEPTYQPASIGLSRAREMLAAQAPKAK